MSGRVRSALIAVSTIVVSGASVWGQCQVTELAAPDLPGSSSFLEGVATDGQRIVIGAPVTGAAFVYRRDASGLDGWVLDGWLAASDGGTNDQFGASAAIEGEWAFIGAPNARAPNFGDGAIYAFRFDGADWVQEQKLRPSDASAKSFGFDLSVSGDYLIASELSYPDSAFIFHNEDGQWVERARLDPSVATAVEGYGLSVDISGDAAIVGAFRDGGVGVVAYFYRLVDGTWQEQQARSLFDPGGDINGAKLSVAIDGNRAIIGRHYFFAQGDRVTTLFYNGVNWDQPIDVSAPGVPDGFGSAVELEGETAFVTEYAPEGPPGPTQGGRTHVYRLDGTTWQHVGTLISSESDPDDFFGMELQVAGGIGITTVRDTANSTARALVFGGLGDCDANGALDICEIASGSASDCDTNGIPDSCEPDCDGNWVPDRCEIALGTALDCNANGIPDGCDIEAGVEEDCNANGVPDACDIEAGTSPDCVAEFGNGIPDECEEDCDGDGLPDSCAIVLGIAPDCNGNGRDDACDIALGFSEDLYGDGIPDECECFGDFDGNGRTDVGDFSYLAGHFGMSVAAHTNGDIDGNGAVDIFDFSIFARSFGCELH